MRTPVLTVLLAATFVIAPAQDLRKTSAAKGACGSPDATFDVDAMPKAAPVQAPDGKALLYVIEQESSTPAVCFGRCGGLTLKVGLDGQWVGATNGNSFLATPIEPGDHHLCVTWQSHFKKLSEKVALRRFTAEAGKTYYFITHDLISSPEAGSMAAFTLDAADSDEAAMLIEGYPQVKASANH